MKQFLTYVVMLIGLLFMQEFVFVRINAYGLVNVFAYIMFIFMLPLTISRGWLLIIGFALGWIVDLMSGTLGLNAMCVVWLAFVRPFVVNYTLGREAILIDVSSITTRFGALRMVGYVSVMCMLFAIPYFMLEVMSFDNILYTLLRIACSTVATTVLILILQLPFSRNG